jgi:transcriptional regulator with GAF, ATPase, and Fis domain
MESILENLKIHINQAANRLETLKTLTKLLLQEIESLAKISPLKDYQSEEKTINLNDSVQRYEIALICSALFQANGNQSKAAKMLEVNTTTLHSKIRRYDIDSLNIPDNFQLVEAPTKSNGNGANLERFHANKNRNNV